ncbi:MAG: type I-E CRISPR-associated protein Cas7/Cse4/CasC [Verrucomicrobiales bacterium]|nr:type I-E CRISPR-associated protein Cas7/Cse4/CasC [Verrucomicrobiales bacterium]
MRLIELHILQSFPVSCLNRDDVGAPKTATFGGVPRARLSSQCLKRAIREYAQDNVPGARFNGQRTKLIVGPFTDALKKHGTPEKAAAEHAANIADKLAKLDARSGKHGEEPQVGTLTFLAPSEIESIAKQVAGLLKGNPKSKDYEKKLDQFCKEAGLLDGADIALFGRMAASLPSLTLEGAAMFSHALSTHRAENDLDFYSAVDDLKPKGEDAGAGMIGTIEFNSAVYYRYAAINLDLLSDPDHLGKLTTEERRKVVDAFIRSILLATPGARKNSMNAHTLPTFVLGLFKKSGQPLQLVNAFEEPVRPRNGLLSESKTRLLEHYQELKKTWGITCDRELNIPEATLNDFVKQLTDYVQ